MKAQKYLYLLCLFVFFNCEDVPNKQKIEKQIQNLQELGTSEYILNKIIIAEDNQWYTIGDKKVIITMKASLKAGVDFSKIKIQNIDNKNSITLKMPKSKIILLDIKPEDIKYNFFKVSLTRANFSNKELNDIQILGEKNIRKKISDLEILKEANENAKLFLKNWLQSFGFKKINFTEI